jgi:hypothetical protein
MYHQYNNNMIITTWTHTKKTENILKEKKKERIKITWTGVAFTVILATWEAEIGRIQFPGQPQQTVLRIQSPK